MDKRKETQLLLAARKTFESMGFAWEEASRHSARARGSPAADARVRLRFGGLSVRYLVFAKTNLKPSTVGFVLHQLRATKARPLLVTDYLTPPLADRLQREGIEFVDAAGNAFLSEPPLLVWVTGRRPVRRLDLPDDPSRLYQPSGLQVLFVLLCEPEAIARPYRDIARMAGVAHGTVGTVMLELERLGFAKAIQGKRRLLRAEELLRRWSEAYARTLRPRLLLGRYRSDTLSWLTAFDPKRFDVLLGGEPAAQILTGYLRPGTATLYTKDVPSHLILGLKLKPAADGNVELRKRFWTLADDNSLVPDVLVYADLLASGDSRCLETAKLVHERIAHRFG